MPEQLAMENGIIPDWPAPENVAAFSTTRAGGVSEGPWASMNLGQHCGDDAQAVAENRALLEGMLAARPFWLRQVHGSHVVQHPGSLTEQLPAIEADAQVSSVAGAVCAILTADCLPVLFCDRQGSQVAAAHAGWRGLAAGVLENTIAAMNSPAHELLAWLGPAIGPAAYEVGSDVKDAFSQDQAEGANAFVSHGERWLFNLYAMARHRLQKAGVKHISGGKYCTLSDPTRFFSYRRDGVTGRMATLVWLKG
jgi:YfiH family protein